PGRSTRCRRPTPGRSRGCSRTGSGCASPVSLAARDFRVAFSTDMVVKDLRLALDVARRDGTVLPVTGLAHELFHAVSAAGRGADDLSSAVLLYERLSGRDQEA